VHGQSIPAHAFEVPGSFGPAYISAAAAAPLPRAALPSRLHRTQHCLFWFQAMTARLAYGKRLNRLVEHRQKAEGRRQEAEGRRQKA